MFHKIKTSTVAILAQVHCSIENCTTFVITFALNHESSDHA